MFTFNRKEQLALVILAAVLLLGTIVSLLERYSDEGLPDFEVRKGVVEVPTGEVETVSEPQQPSIININTASAKELKSLPRIGPQTAQRIIECREENGPFTSVDELTSVRGIGPKTLDRLYPLITVTPP